MDIRDILEKCDHTLLRVDCTAEEIRALCDQAIRYHCASVCIPPCHVAGARRYAGDGLTLCTVIGFPNGYMTTAAKVAETADAVLNGADEVDMVIHVGAAKAGDFDAIEHEIKAVRKACEGKVLKVIIETCLLTDDEKIALCGVVSRSGADYIKTSTGFSKGGATKHDIELFAAHKADHLKMKAAGGIRSWEDAEAYLALGCDRLGTSAIVKLMKNEEVKGY